MQQRKFPRFNTAFNASCSALGDALLLPCRIVEISRGGARIELFSKYGIDTGSTVALHIEIPGIAERIVASFECMWTRSAPDGETGEGHVIGGCFSDLSPEDRHVLMKNISGTT